MNNVLIIDNEKAVVSYDAELGLFRGEFLGLNGGADFYSDSVGGLIKEGRKSLAVFMEMCAEHGIEPRKHFSGRFNVRLSPKVHEAAVLAAAATNKSLNEWVADTIKQAVHI